ncbi:hypothetical protein V1511DRAFT_490314 [Dipodascopsis uninucleata]
MNVLALLFVMTILVFGVILMPVINGVGKYNVAKPAAKKSRYGKPSEKESAQENKFVSFKLAEGTSTAIKSALDDDDKDDKDDNNDDDDAAARMRSRKVNITKDNKDYEV